MSRTTLGEAVRDFPAAPTLYVTGEPDRREKKNLEKKSPLPLSLPTGHCNHNQNLFQNLHSRRTVMLQ
jgi:hypothetical protein